MRPPVQILHVRVKPNARIRSLEPTTVEGQWLATLKAPPRDGKANAELIALVAERFGCPKSAVQITHGASGRIKRVQIG